MMPRLPICCRPDAFAYLTRLLPALESSDGLLQAACAVALHFNWKVNPGAIDLTLQGYADTVRLRVRGSQPQALFAHLHEFLFEEEKFIGDLNDLHNPANCYLDTVLQTKCGMPLTLGLIYVVVASRLGFKSWGVGLPGSFLTGITVGGKRVFINPFDRGSMVTSDEIQIRMKEAQGHEEWSEEFLEPYSHRRWVTRIMQGLLNVWGNRGNYSAVSAMLEMQILLWPEETKLQRDLAHVLIKVGKMHNEQAAQLLNHYIDGNPDDLQVYELQKLLEILAK